MRYILPTLVILFLISCENKAISLLKDLNWSPKTKERLENILTQHTEQGHTIVFDFDNTIICRDIGEATFEVLAYQETQLLAKNIKRSTPQEILDGFDLEKPEHLVQIYEKMLMIGAGTKDTEPYAIGYNWVVQVMNNLTISQIEHATSSAYQSGSGAKDTLSDVSVTKVHSYARPFFYPEMVDLVGNCIKLGYNVHIVSASNIWTVRWMVEQQLNPILKSQFGPAIFVQSTNIKGINTLLFDPETKQYFKDENAILNLSKEKLANLKTTTQTVFPISAYHGKVANIIKHIGKQKPLLVIGDSPNDIPMLNYSLYKLWIARLEKPNYQKILHQNEIDKSWIIQPTRYKSSPGFVKNETDH